MRLSQDGAGCPAQASSGMLRSPSSASDSFRLLFPAHPAPGTISRDSTESWHLSCPCPASWWSRTFCCLWTAPFPSSTQSLLYMWPLGSYRCAVQKNVWPICVSREWHLLTSDLQNIISRKCSALQMKFSICKFLLVLLSLLMPWESKPWQLMFCCFDVLNNVFCQPSNTILFLWRHLMLQLENLTTTSLYCVEWSVFTFAWPPLAQQHYSSRHQKGNECPTTP